MDLQTVMLQEARKAYPSHEEVDQWAEQLLRQSEEIIPNILLIPTMAFGMMRGRREGMVVGFISGLLLDIFYGVMIGPYALLYMYLGYINGFFHRVYYMEDLLLPMLMSGANDLAFG